MSEPDRTQPTGGRPPELGPHDTQPRGRPPRAASPAGASPRAVPPAAPIHVGGDVGGDVVAGDLNRVNSAGRDVAGRDIVTTTATTNTYVGFTFAQVQRLVITVGVLVMATAGFFFVLGGVVLARPVAALNTQLASDSPSADAAAFAARLDELRALPAGTQFALSFTEAEIAAYFELLVAPSLPDVNQGRLRLLDTGQVVIGGRAEALGGRRFAAVFDWQHEPGAPLDLRAAGLRLIPFGPDSLGWVYVPTPLLGGVEDNINQLFGDVQLTGVESGDASEPWTVIGVTR